MPRELLHAPEKASGGVPAKCELGLANNQMALIAGGRQGLTLGNNLASADDQPGQRVRINSETTGISIPSGDQYVLPVGMSQTTTLPVTGMRWLSDARSSIRLRRGSAHISG